MTKIPTVKARARQGTRSLDITIPTSIIKEYDICEGDVFALEIETTTMRGKKQVILKYRRVFSQSRSMRAR